MRPLLWRDGSVKSDPINGWERNYVSFIGDFFWFLKRSDKTNWYALVGTIEKNDEYSFAIVNEHSNLITMCESRELYFYANDMHGRYFNNKGSLQLKLIRASDYINN